MTEQLRAELLTWIDENWDPEITVKEWWRRLSNAGLSNPPLGEPFGRSWDRGNTRLLASVIRERGAVGSPAGLGMMLAAPTILSFGTDEQIKRYVPRILDGTDSWC